MKLRSREVNVFSMSALDLFASAMGAFMFLAIMALPFFPNTGKDPKLPESVKQKLRETEAELKNEKDKKSTLEKSIANKKIVDAQQKKELEQLKEKIKQQPKLTKVNKQSKEIEKLKNQNEELKKESKRPKVAFPSMDIVIALDTTSSMENEVAGIKNEIVQLADLLMKLSPNAAMGLIGFKDQCERVPVRSLEITKLTRSSLNRLQGFANSLRSGSSSCNNNNPPEAINLAMIKALSMKWRNSSKAKKIIIISDNGVYAYKENEVLASAKKFSTSGKRNKVSSVFVDTSARGSTAAGKPFLQALARAGGGNFVQNRSSFTATILLTLTE